MRDRGSIVLSELSVRNQLLRSEGIKTGRESIFAPVSEHIRRRVSILGCELAIFRCLDLKSPATRAMNLGLLMTVFQNWCMDCAKLTPLCAVQATKVSDAVERQLLASLRLTISVPNTSLPTTSRRVPVFLTLRSQRWAGHSSGT